MKALDITRVVIALIGLVFLPKALDIFAMIWSFVARYDMNRSVFDGGADLSVHYILLGSIQLIFFLSLLCASGFWSRLLFRNLEEVEIPELNEEKFVGLSAAAVGVFIAAVGILDISEHGISLYLNSSSGLNAAPYDLPGLARGVVGLVIGCLLFFQRDGVLGAWRSLRAAGRVK